MAIDTQTLTQLITEFRSLTVKDSITPESLGSILQRIATFIDALRNSLESSPASESFYRTMISPDKSGAWLLSC
jgi:hypothetical protein